MLAGQEKELGHEWFIKRINRWIVCVYMFTNEEIPVIAQG